MSIRFAWLAVVVLAAVWALGETRLPDAFVWIAVGLATLLAYTRHNKRPGSKAPRC